MRSYRIPISLMLGTALALGACAGNGAGSSPTPGPTEEPPQGAMARGRVYLDEIELLVMESYPIQLAVHLEGDLPTPCHTLQWGASGADEEGNIRVEVYSEAPTELECIQVLEPFEETVQLGTVESGTFTVFVNGEEIGTVDA